MGKAEIMLKVLSSPDVDAASVTAMLGDTSDVQQLLALRAGGLTGKQLEGDVRRLKRWVRTEDIYV